MTASHPALSKASSSQPALPIEAITPDIVQALAEGNNCVLIAPPGAGKTTHLPLVLYDQPWMNGRKLLVVEPRRLAALGAARRMASLVGETVGQRVGHRVRLDTKVGPQTRIEVVTDGVFARMILADPELSNVAAILFDEVHERALAADLGLAFALEAQAVLRPDLRLVAMSATVDGAQFERVLGHHAPVVQIISDGAMHPVETHYEPATGGTIEAITDATCRAFKSFSGDGLVFLPGQRDIEAAVSLLRERLGPSVMVHRLYGAVPRTEQDAALTPDPQGRRKITIASAIAQTSLTIPGVRFVVDSGLARLPFYDPVRGVTRLQTRQASRAALDQRRGRAGREAPGHCVRLWRKEEEGGRPAQDRPEIVDADLASMRLDMAAWGTTDRAGLLFLQPPPQTAWDQAGALLTSLGALDGGGAITDLGKRMARRATHPRLAAMLEQVAPAQKSDAAWAAVLTEELADRGAVDGSQRLADALANKQTAKRLRTLQQRFADVRPGKMAHSHPPSADQMVELLLLAFPDRVAKRQKDDGRHATYKLAQGMQVQLEAHHPLANALFLVVLDMGSGDTKAGLKKTLLANVRMALPVAEEVVRRVLHASIEKKLSTRFDPKDWTVQVRAQDQLAKLVLSEETRPRLSRLDALEAIATHIRAKGMRCLAGSDHRKQAIVQRYERFLDTQGDHSLLDRLDLWLPTLLGLAAPPDFEEKALRAAFQSALDWQEQQDFAAQWPDAIVLAGGRRATIQYDHPAGPAISVRPQWLYGWDIQPTYGPDKVNVLVELLSPAGRPIQITADLPGFWRGAWGDVRKEMRARYPKHDWPEQPWSAKPPSRSAKHGDGTAN